MLRYKSVRRHNKCSRLKGDKLTLPPLNYMNIESFKFTLRLHKTDPPPSLLSSDFRSSLAKLQIPMGVDQRSPWEHLNHSGLLS